MVFFRVGLTLKNFETMLDQMVAGALEIGVSERCIVL